MASQTDNFVNRLSELGLATETTPVPEMPEDGFVAQWAGQRILRLTGPDARKFLQGQLSCQIEDLTTARSLFAAACSPKGKALANFRILALDNGDILLRLSANLEQPTLKHFQKYLAFFKAQMETAEDWCLLGITGDYILGLMNAPRPDGPGSVVPWQHSLLVGSVPDAQERSRYELWLNRADVAELEVSLRTLRDQHLLAPQSAWLASEIQSGLTVIDERLRDRYVPQYFNWHAVSGISFRKGCYTGQEIIARMHYLGQLKKSTFRLLLPQGGASVLAALTDAGGRAVGEITNFATYHDGRQEALAVVQHVAAKGVLHLADAPEYPVLVGSLPYQVPEQEGASEK